MMITLCTEFSLNETLQPRLQHAKSLIVSFHVHRAMATLARDRACDCGIFDGRGTVANWAEKGMPTSAKLFQLLNEAIVLLLGALLILLAISGRVGLPTRPAA